MEQKFKVGECYRLNPKYYYYVVSLAEHVSFKDPMAVMITKLQDEKPKFGRLIRIKKGDLRTDDISMVEIGINENVLCEKYEVNPQYSEKPFNFFKKLF